MANAALLGTIGDQTSSQAAGAIAQLMPSGVILPFGGGTAPADGYYAMERPSAEQLMQIYLHLLVLHTAAEMDLQLLIYQI
jgi:hypothetical protein